MNSELLSKAMEAKSPEELIAVAKETGRELSAEQAEKLFSSLKNGGELSDDELDSAVGGGCAAHMPRLEIDCKCLERTGLSEWTCRICGSRPHRKGPNPYICEVDCEHAIRMKKLNCYNCANLESGVCTALNEKVK